MNMNLGDSCLLVDEGRNHTGQITSFGRYCNRLRSDYLVKSVPPNY